MRFCRRVCGAKALPPEGVRVEERAERPKQYATPAGEQIHGQFARTCSSAWAEYDRKRIRVRQEGVELAPRTIGAPRAGSRCSNVTKDLVVVDGLIDARERRTRRLQPHYRPGFGQHGRHQLGRGQRPERSQRIYSPARTPDGRLTVVESRPRAALARRRTVDEARQGHGRAVDGNGRTADLERVARGRRTLEAFARRNGFGAQRLQWWVKRLGLKDQGATRASFVPVVVRQAIVHDRVPVAVVVDGTARLEVLELTTETATWVGVMLTTMCERRS
jgi:hypothetical protein